MKYMQTEPESNQIHGPTGMTTIHGAAQKFLGMVQKSRSQNTFKTYSNAIKQFLLVLNENGFPVETEPVDGLTEKAIALFIETLHNKATASEKLYTTAVISFYEFVASEELATINLVKVRSLAKQRNRRVGQRFPQFPKTDIEKLLDYANSLLEKPEKDEKDRLINLRDRAFLITLADTGLRVHEACKLSRGDINWYEGKAVVIGKGDKMAVIRFSKRALDAIQVYLNARRELDGATGRLAGLPLFARHDRGSGAKTLRMTTAAGRYIVRERVKECLGSEAVGTITPHSFRHYFVTRILHGSGNLKLAQELARHTSVSVTQRYAHLNDDDLDRGFHEVIEE